MPARTGYRPDIPPHVAEVVRHLPLELKRSVKAALRALSTDPTRGQPLMRELEGFWKYRVRRYRVVYDIRRREHVIRVIAVGHRLRIYEDVASERSGRSRGIE